MNFNFLLDNAASSADAAQQQNPGQIWMLLGMYSFRFQKVQWNIFQISQRLIMILYQFNQ